MGIASWIVAGIVAAVAARFVPYGRVSRLRDFGPAIAAAVVFGVMATALDFGGWNEPDWRAAVFCLLGGASAVAALRLRRLR